MACRLEEGPFCAPCGAMLAGASIALTFSYDYFDVVVLDTEFEVGSLLLDCEQAVDGCSIMRKLCSCASMSQLTSCA